VDSAQIIADLGLPGAVAQLLVPADTLHGSRTTGSFTLACTTSFSDERPVATEPTPYEVAVFMSAGFGPAG
jgi:hypothetical protein